MARWYIIHKTHDPRDSWRPVAGPFDSRAEAEADPLSAGYHPRDSLGNLDMTYEVGAQIVTRTWLVRQDMFPATPQGKRVLATRIIIAKMLPWPPLSPPRGDPIINKEATNG